MSRKKLPRKILDNLQKICYGRSRDCIFQNFKMKGGEKMATNVETEKAQRCMNDELCYHSEYVAGGNVGGLLTTEDINARRTTPNKKNKPAGSGIVCYGCWDDYLD